MRTSWLHLCAFVLFGATALFGQANDGVTRERTFYVPFDELEKVFEKEGRGIFLPYDEFLRLWEKAEGSDTSTAGSLPVRAAVRGGIYRGVVGDGEVRFTVDFEIDAVGAGWSSVPLPLTGIAVDEVTLSDPGALFVHGPNGYAVHVPKAGRYQLTVAFAARVVEEPGKKSFRFGIPSIAVSKLELTIPEP
ncbi:MAG: hypothetical protein AAF488_04225, partial [Planctomycetota bacterium]